MRPFWYFFLRGLLLSFQIEDFETSIIRFDFFFSQSFFPEVEKLKISAIYEAIIVIFSVFLFQYLCWSFKSNYLKNHENIIKVKFNKKSSNNPKIIRYILTGRFDILWCIFESSANKLKMKSKERKSIVFGNEAVKEKIFVYLAT